MMNPKSWRDDGADALACDDDNARIAPYFTYLKEGADRLDACGLSVAIGAEEVNLPLPVLERALDRIYGLLSRRARELATLPLSEEIEAADDARQEALRSLLLNAQAEERVTGRNRPELRPVVIESPFRDEDPGRKAAHARYLHDAIVHCLSRGEAPYASHAYLTQHLNDDVPHHRALGIGAGIAIAEAMNAKHVVYVDRGITEGMLLAIEAARTAGRVVEYRSLWWWVTPWQGRKKKSLRKA